MSTEAIMIVISGCVLLSYWFSHLARRFRFPSVVFLLIAGLLLREFTDSRGSTVSFPPSLLPLLGSIGLILIVLEGGLDLNLRPGRRAFLRRTFLAALVGVVLCAAVLAQALHMMFGMPWFHGAMLAMPFAVISSAVAIPSAEVLADEDREFVIYESSWSDIVGVMLFNAAVAVGMGGAGGEATLELVVGGAMVVVLGVGLSLALYWLVGHLEGHVKFLPLIFALILVYATAKSLHLSPLVIVLILGLMLNNSHLFLRFPRLAWLRSDRYDAELGKLKSLTAEATFFVRTFFFLLLGYSTDMATLADLKALAWAVAIVAGVFVLRIPVLKAFGHGQLRPLLWAAPRGLITVLLFYSLPPGTVPASFPPGALILVVLLSCALMAVGFMVDGKRNVSSADDGITRRLEADAAPPP